MEKNNIEDMKARYVFKERNKEDVYIVVETYILDKHNLDMFLNNWRYELVSIDEDTGMVDKYLNAIYVNDYVKCSSELWNNPTILIQKGYICSNEAGMRVGYDFSPATMSEEMEKIGNWWENHKDIDDDLIIYD